MVVCKTDVKLDYLIKQCPLCRSPWGVASHFILGDFEDQMCMLEDDVADSDEEGTPALVVFRHYQTEAGEDWFASENMAEWFLASKSGDFGWQCYQEPGTGRLSSTKRYALHSCLHHLMIALNA